MLRSAALCAFVCTGIAASSHAQNAAPLFEETRCDFPEAPAAVVARLRCGTVAVPRLYEDPAAGEYRLRIAVLKSALTPVQPDALLVLVGGPGQAGVVPLVMAAENLPSFDRDLVFVDLRGIDGSEPRICREGVFDAWYALLAADLTADELGAEFDEMVERCFDEARAQGHEAASFGSRIDAHDLEHVRSALGIPYWNVLGTSYGGVTALTFIGRYPDSVRALVLDSPGLGALAPVTRKDGWTSGVDALVRACAANRACAASYPDLGAEIERTLERLEVEPLRFSSAEQEMVINRADLELFIFGGLYNSAPLVPATIRAGAERRGEPFVDGFVVAASILAQSDLFVWGAVLCRDIPPGAKARRPVSEPPAGFEAILPESACAGWTGTDPAPQELAEVTIPTLVLSGTLDPVAPPAMARHAASLIGASARHLEFPGVGHAVLPASRCAEKILVDFLAEPSAPLDTSCIDDTPPLSFTQLEPASQ